MVVDWNEMYPGFIDFIVSPTLAVCGDMVAAVLGEEAEVRKVSFLWENNLDIFMLRKLLESLTLWKFRMNAGEILQEICVKLLMQWYLWKAVHLLRYQAVRINYTKRHLSRYLTLQLAAHSHMDLWLLGVQFIQLMVIRSLIWPCWKFLSFSGEGEMWLLWPGTSAMDWIPCHK